MTTPSVDSSASSPIDVRNEIINYPVNVGDIVEIAASEQRGGAVRLRLARFHGVSGSSVIVELVEENASGGTGPGLMFQFGYGDVRLPVWYVFRHPIAL